MSTVLTIPSLSSEAYYDPAILDQEREQLLSTHWQWVGLIDQLTEPGKLTAEVAGLPIKVQNDAGGLAVYFDAGGQSHKLEQAQVDTCGRFVFVRFTKSGPALKEYLGKFADVLEHCTTNFAEAYHVESVEWNCNWKVGLEVTLEGYHVPTVHDQSNFTDAIPEGLPAVYEGPHSYQSGLMSDQMRAEMSNIAKRLKIAQSTMYTNYDHFTIFPNMTVGISGGNLCFLQIYNPIDANRTRLSYAYMLAKQLDPAVAPSPAIKTTLLNKWRDYTHQVLNEDKTACEMFQRGIKWSQKPGLLGRVAEERVAHFQKHWRQIMDTKINIKAA